MLRKDLRESWGEYLKQHHVIDSNGNEKDEYKDEYLLALLEFFRFKKYLVDTFKPYKQSKGSWYLKRDLISPIIKSLEYILGGGIGLAMGAFAIIFVIVSSPFLLARYSLRLSRLSREAKPASDIAAFKLEGRKRVKADLSRLGGLLLHVVATFIVGALFLATLPLLLPRVIIRAAITAKQGGWKKVTSFEDDPKVTRWVEKGREELAQNNQRTTAGIINKIALKIEKAEKRGHQDITSGVNVSKVKADIKDFKQSFAQYNLSRGSAPDPELSKKAEAVFNGVREKPKLSGLSP